MQGKMKHFHNSFDEQHYNSKYFHHIPNNKKITKLIYTCIQEPKKNPQIFP